MMWHNGEWWQFGMGYGVHWVFMIAFWGLVIWALFALVRRIGGRGSEREEDSAQAILGRRFARGEIGAAEFQKMSETLARAGQ